MASRTFSSAGRLDFASEGYRLTWGPEGLTVEVIDYHTKPLGLSWGFLRELVDAAQRNTETGEPS